MEDLTGKQLGPYQIVAPLGEGGMAAVYKAYQPAMERYVALKVLPRHFASDPQFVARFQREAKLLAQLQHPHILPVHDFGEADGYTYLVMPFIPSGTLTDLLKGQPLPLPRIHEIITQVGGALDYAHARGLIHRDVKPSNVLIDETGNCLLTDFGLARMVEASVNLTASGTIMGTPAYMSPEQGSGQPLDARSDIYSLGVILYEVATGRVPYKAETPIAVIFKHIQDPLPPARTVNPALPEAVERVILKSLAKSPEDRYQTAGEMVRAIQAVILEPTQPGEAVPAQTESAAAVDTAPSKVVEAPIRRDQVKGPQSVTKPKTVRPTGIWVVGGLLVLGTLVCLAAVSGGGIIANLPALQTVVAVNPLPKDISRPSATAVPPTSITKEAVTSTATTLSRVVSDPTPPGPPIPISTEAAGQLIEAWKSAIDSAQNGQVSVVVNETQITSFLALKLAEQQNPPLTDVQVYLRDGKVQIFGDAKADNVSTTVLVVLAVNVDPEGQISFALEEADFGPMPVPKALLLKSVLLSGVNEALTGKVGSFTTGIKITSIGIADGNMAIIGMLTGAPYQR